MTEIRVVFGDSMPARYAGAGSVRAIQAHDPTFNTDTFLSFAQGVFTMVTEARAKGDAESVGRFISDGMAAQLRGAGAEPSYADVTVEHASVTGGSSANGWDTVIVRFLAQPSSTGHHHAASWTEDWTFQRPIPPAPPEGAPTGPGPAATQCPNCGAPLALDENGACRYCRASVGGGLGGWKLVRTERRSAEAQASVAKAGRGFARTITAIVIISVVLGIVIPIFAASKTASRAVASRPTIPDISIPDFNSIFNQAQQQAQQATSADLSGRATFSGGFAGSTDGDVTTTGATTGPCAAHAANLLGLTFKYDEDGEDNGATGTKALGFTLTLPAGAKGPGTYTLPAAKLAIDATFVFTPDPGEDASAGFAQTWHVGPATAGAFVLQADDSGTLNVTGLVPTEKFDPHNSLSKPLNIVFHLTCA